MKTSNSQATVTASKSDNAPKSNTKAHDQLGLTSQADKDAHDLKVAATIAALATAKSAPTRTDITPSKTVSSSDVFTIDVNECIRLKDDGNYGIIAPQHMQLNELFIEQAMDNQDSWSFDEGGHCLVAISWTAINDSLKDADGNPMRWLIKKKVQAQAGNPILDDNFIRNYQGHENIETTRGIYADHMNTDTSPERLSLEVQALGNAIPINWEEISKNN